MIERRSRMPRRVPQSGYGGPERRIAKNDRRGGPPPEAPRPPVVAYAPRKKVTQSTLKYDEELKECVRAHEEAVITNDEYGIEDLARLDPNIKYIVDIGANVGCASFQFQRFFPTANIICCEPEPKNMHYAKENTNYSRNIKYVEKAVVGDPTLHEVKFNVCHWAGNHHVDGHFRWDLFAPMGSRKVGEITVPAVTLKQLIDDCEFPQIDLLKIDCEGLEGEILREFKPWMKLVKHFRGEWHGEADIALIEDAFKDTHNITFDRKFTTHGDIIAELK